jgi:hypothetical protein
MLGRRELLLFIQQALSTVAQVRREARLRGGEGRGGQADGLIAVADQRPDPRDAQQHRPVILAIGERVGGFLFCGIEAFV